MRSLVRELTGAARRLRRSPGFAAAAVLTLGLGIGVNTALFSVANAVLLRPLPFPHAERLVTVWELERSGTEMNTGFPTFRDWAERSRSLESAAAAGYWVPTLTGAGRPERLEGLKVSAAFFATLGVRPALGRDFLAQEDRPGADRVVLVSSRLWQRQFAGDARLPGRLLTLDGVPHTVVGVLPASLPEVLSTNHQPSADVFKPLGYDATMMQACRSCRHLWVLGRLRAGVAPEAAQRELTSVMQQLVLEHPTDYATVGALVRPLRDHLTAEAKPVLVALVSAALFLLALACVNLAGLHLARGLERRPEVALRAALGASRGRLAAHVLGESVLLSLVGGALGAVIAGWGVALLRSLAPEWVPRLQEARVDAPALSFALGVSIACGLLLGALPALHAAGAAVQDWLREGSRHGASAGRQRWQRVLLAGQVGLAAILLVGAVLTLKSLGRLLDVRPGFEPRGLVTAQVDVPYADRARAARFYEGLVDALVATPGVTAAGAASQIPLGGNFDMWGIHVEGQSAANPDDDPAADFYAATPGYRRAMEIPLVRGRDLAASDTREAPAVVLVNQSLAGRFWPGADPLGRRLRIGAADGPWRVVVGVVGDVRHHGLAARPGLQVYVPHAQVTTPSMAFVVRAPGQVAQAAAALRAAVAAQDPDVPVADLRSGDDLVTASVLERRFVSRILTGFGVAAGALVAVGLVGALAQLVTRRRREIGVRIVLGAQRWQVLALLGRQGLAPAAAGLAAGLLVSPLTGRVLLPMLYEVPPADPATLAVVALTLTATATAACLVPARRAARVDPAVVLRGD
jgi:putative ABC transport system permease protein